MQTLLGTSQEWYKISIFYIFISMVALMVAFSSKNGNFTSKTKKPPLKPPLISHYKKCIFAPWSRGRVPKLRNVHKLHTYDQIVSRHVPIWGDWRPKLTNLTKSLNSTRPTEGTFYRPHVVFCYACIANSEISTSVLPVLRADRRYAICNLEPPDILYKLSGLDVTLFLGSNKFWQTAKCVKATL